MLKIDIRVYYSQAVISEDRVEPLAQKHDRIAEANCSQHSDVVILLRSG